MSELLGTCPKCNGTGRCKLTQEYAWMRNWCKSPYNSPLQYFFADTDEKVCDNCGGQTMSSQATGKVRLRADGSPCLHSFESKNIGRCLNRHTCKECGTWFDIDSGD